MKQYRVFLFDMDGVMTQELCYWKAAAMTVWEFLYREDPAVMVSREEEIFETVFCGKEIIHNAKQAGVNTNYDLSYVTAALAYGFINEKRPFECVRDFFRERPRRVPLLYAQCLEAAGGAGWEYQGRVWHQLYDLFQSWYLGDGTEKEGMMQLEQPLFPPQQLKNFLMQLREKGIEAGIGTGRPRPEIVPHLKRWGLLELFDQQRIITQSEIDSAQKRARELGRDVSLSKPHFYIFGKGVAGLSFDDMAVLDRRFDLSLLEKTLVIGDAGADIYAAKALGVDFAAVLTGVSGKAERSFFEELHADYIFDNVFGLLELL